ncbi:MAG: hypothetical protein WC004_02640, partial [Candidatus Absconditabacterales bacterium]
NSGSRAIDKIYSTKKPPYGGFFVYFVVFVLKQHRIFLPIHFALEILIGIRCAIGTKIACDALG